MKVMQVLLPEQVRISEPPQSTGGIGLIDLEDQTRFDKRIFVNLNLDQIEDEI